MRNHSFDRVANVEFLVQLKGGKTVWLETSNVSEDLRRDYENSWWAACREGGSAVLRFLNRGGAVLVLARDKQLRSGLHYVCGLGDTQVVEAMIDCGAEINALDKDGYTPLHIAAGYLHEQTVSVLMTNGADPTLEDNSGRSALSLVEALLQNTPATTALFTKRLAMEAVLTTLRSYMFEEIVPRAIIDKRTTSQTQYFVDWFDGYDPIWVDETDIADDLIKEFESGVERASVSKIIHTKNLSAAVEYPALSLVQWSDDSLLSWSMH